jgi:hypothetical protein
MWSKVNHWLKDLDKGETDGAARALGLGKPSAGDLEDYSAEEEEAAESFRDYDRLVENSEEKAPLSGFKLDPKIFTSR